jgi:hypothetical protein
MPQFDPELIQMMRTVLDDVMSRVPLEISGPQPRLVWLKTFLKPPHKVIRVTTS